MIVEKSTLENLATMVTETMHDINSSDEEYPNALHWLEATLTTIYMLNIDYEVHYSEENGNYEAFEINGKYFAVEDDEEQ